MQTAEACLARYNAENIEYGRGASSTAASLGTAVHGALELYVKSVYIEQTAEPTLKYLLDLFRMSFMTTFNTVELVGEDYDDGVQMLKDWHKRTDFNFRKVVSCEVKTSFPIPTSIGDIPFNYTWDRFDQTRPTEYRVVDYKTIRWGFAPGDLRKKIQARAYALAAQIQHPDATKIWVEFDLLRHDGPIGIVFTRDDNIATWKFLKTMAQKIVDTDEKDIVETVNPTCNFCVRKTSCKALLANVKVGGVFSITDVRDVIDHRAKLEYQRKAISSALTELDEHLLTLAKAEDEFEYASSDNKLTVTVSSRRSVDPDMAAMVLPDDVFRKYGGRSFTMGAVDKLLKGDEIDEQQKKQLRALIFQKQGEPSIKVEPKGAIEDD